MRAQSVLRMFRLRNLETSFGVHLVIFCNMAFFATSIRAIDNTKPAFLWTNSLGLLSTTHASCAESDLYSVGGLLVLAQRYQPGARCYEIRW